MNVNQATLALDPSSLTAFTATLAALPRDDLAPEANTLLAQLEG